MDMFKKQVQQKLIANVIMDKCSQSEHLIFRDAWCTQERVIRFTTPFFRKLFSFEAKGTGKWKTGDCVMYEANNGTDSFIVHCVLNTASVPHAMITQQSSVLTAVNAVNAGSSSDIFLKSWNLTEKDGNINTFFENFDYLIQKQIPYFEQELQEKIEKDNSEQDVLKEGNIEHVTLNKYERNSRARAACIAAHGTACTVCGINFAKAYGPEFAGKIEVHHIVPLSEIGAEYVVDPVDDLVPVCPNCHTALHSKKDGIYTIEELIKMRTKH